jgi:6-phosphogluconolactonase
MIHQFGSPDQLAAALAEAVAGALLARLAIQPEVALAVSGGSTPRRFLQALALQPIDWQRVHVTLVDERWVGETSPRSNAAMVRATLFRDCAAVARWLPLYDGADSPEAALPQREAALASLPLPFAAVVLGMGLDGHTASFFADADALAAALQPPPGTLLSAQHAPSAGEPRISLTLPVLLAADSVFLHIEGEDKRAVLEAALAPGPASAMPVRAILARRPPPELFYCQ